MGRSFLVHNRSRILAMVLAASFVAVSASPGAYAEGSVDTLKNQQTQYTQQQQENNAKLAELRNDATQKEAYGATLQSQLDAIEEQINGYSNQMTNLDLQIQQAEDEISKKQKQIDADNQKLKERLRALYMSGGASNLEILLSAHNLVDLSDKSEAITMVTEHDTTLINQLKSEKAAVQKAKESIQSKRQQVTDAKSDFDAKHQQLSETLSETQQFLQKVGAQETSLQAQNASLDVQAAKTAAALDSWSQKQTQPASASGSAKSTDSQASSSQSQAAGQSQQATGTSGASASASVPSSSSSSTGSGGGAASSSSSFARLISEAEKYLGTPYVMGGTSPSTGFDCSSFVCWVFTHSGVYNLPRTTAQGIYDQCSKVSVSQARPGDIVFFTGTYDCGSPVTHVGIYVGSGTMIEAGGSEVQYTSIDNSYWRQHFYAFGRLG